jgi:hypothetical protein
MRECKKMYGAGMRIKAVTLGFVLAGTALGSAALTLGRARGAAWIGQPFEVLVPVQLDPGQSGADLCAEADVFHGDSRQDSGKVTVQVQPSDQPETFNLKVSSLSLVDEPVVTIYLRAGCVQKLSRKYVLLADFPSDGAAPLSRSATPAVPQVPLLVPTEGPTKAAATPADASGAAAVSQPTKLPPSAERRVNKPNQKISVQQTAKPAVADVPKEPAPAKPEKPVEPLAQSDKPRLRLDPIDSLSDRIKMLESSTTDNTQQDDATRDSQRMQSLQNDLKALLDQAVKNEASLAAMRERLERAESDRVPVAVVYGLGAVALLCLGALAFMWGKRPRRSVPVNRTVVASGVNSGAPRPSAPTPLEDEAPEFDVNTEDVDKASFDALVADQKEVPKDETLGKQSELPPAPKTPRSDFNADRLVDLRQEAEFLAKLGKIDDALQVLKDGIRSNPKESPLLFLDLLGIANNYNRGSDFNQYRAQFVDLFNVNVPEVALSKDEGRSLDAYPALLEHINSQWKSVHVLDVIEACIVRDPDAKESDPFDLAAFRELLNMHGVAREHHSAEKVD